MSGRHKLGASPADRGTHFVVWSDKAADIKVHWVDERAGEEGEIALVPRGDEAHVYEAFAEGVGTGVLYEVLIDGSRAVDPYARSLPRGVHGLAEVVSPPLPRAHPKRGIDLRRGEVFYELHIGTFTQDGTFASAAQHLQKLVQLGVTVIEVMPVAAFSGSRGWGYDGVGLFATFAPYGSAQDLSSFIDTAHGCGLSVVLDVVYNHLGPDGNYLPMFSDSYFDSARKNPWGRAPAFEKQAFRRYVTDNARYWLEELGFDGLRLDAAHELEPGGDPHILEDLSNIARACSPRAFLVAEDDRNDPGALLRHGIDAVWSDDFHHSAHVLLTAERDGYYSAYEGTLTELARVIERGQLYEGQVFEPTGIPRGKPALELPRERLIYALQNHDQVGNRALGERLHALASANLMHAVTALALLLPATPMLFMGQEWAATAPFQYFSDYAGELGAAVTAGRLKEFARFASFRDAALGSVPDPQAEATFLRSKLDWSERDNETLHFHCGLLELRRTDPVLSACGKVRAGVAGGVLWVTLASAAGRRLLLLNAGGAVSPGELGGVLASEAALLLATRGGAHTGSTFQLAPESFSLFAG